MSDGRRIGVLGGAFDPPHIGHLIVAQEAWWQLGLDEVWLVPLSVPADRPAPRFPADVRVRMVEVAVDGHPALRCSDIELRRDGPSYTADTLEQIRREHPGAHLWFILGGDRLEGLPGWHQPHRILAAARLAVVTRAGEDAQHLRDTAERVAPGGVDVLTVPHIGVSSTMLRQRMAEGRPVRYLVPAGVESLIDAHACAGDGGELP